MMDPACETYKDRGCGPVSVINVLSVSVESGIIFGAETWFLLAAMSRKLEGVHVCFLRQVMGKKAKRRSGGTWISKSAVKILVEAGIQTLGAYIDRQQWRSGWR